MVVFLVYRRKNEILSLLVPLETFLWLAVEKSANVSATLEKNPFDAHASEQEWELCWHHASFESIKYKRRW